MASIAAVAGSLGAAALFAGSAPSFAVPQKYSAHSPLSVAIGDLNGDGKPDVATANDISNTVSVFINTPGLCTAQDVRGQALQAAKRRIARANCRVGKIRRAYSRVKKGRVISQQPRPSTVLPGGGKVNLVVSRGRKPS